jgi:hypothetical protein
VNVHNLAENFARQFAFLSRMQRQFGRQLSTDSALVRLGFNFRRPKGPY